MNTSLLRGEHASLGAIFGYLSLTLACLAGGCGGDVVSPSIRTSAAGGASAEATTTQAGQGGAATTSGSGAAGGGGGAAECGPCGAGERCLAGHCVVIEATLFAGLSEAILLSGVGLPAEKGADFAACSYDAGATHLPAALPLGSCVVVAADAPTAVFSWGGGAGEVSASSAAIGSASVAMVLATPGPCKAKGVSSPGPFLAGDPVTFGVEGGDAFPPMTKEVTVPEPLLITTDSMTYGMDLELTWIGSGAEPINAIVAALGDLDAPSIQCRFADTGSFTVPASQMAELDPSASVGLIYLSRTRAEEVLPESAAVVFTAAVTTADGRMVSYLP